MDGCGNLCEHLFWEHRSAMLIRLEMFTVPTWWLPSACEWGRWRAGWSPPRSRSTGSSRWSSSGRRSPEHYDTARFDLATSSWEDERDEQESLVGAFNIASWLLDLLLAVFPFLPHFLSKLVASPRRRVNQQKCRGQNCPTVHLSSLLGGYMIAKLTAWSNLFLASHEKLNWSLSCNLLSAISTWAYPYLPALRLQCICHCPLCAENVLLYYHHLPVLYIPPTF